MKINKCDECGSQYYKEKSKMSSLCPECAHYLYGYPNCKHEIVEDRCNKCYWDGSTTPFIKNLKDNSI